MKIEIDWRAFDARTEASSMQSRFLHKWYEKYRGDKHSITIEYDGFSAVLMAMHDRGVLSTLVSCGVLPRPVLVRMQFPELGLYHTDFSDFKFRRCVFEGSDMRSNIFRGANFEHSKFHLCNLEDSRFTHTGFLIHEFEGCNMRHTEHWGVEATMTTAFRKCDLRDAVFTNCDLSHVSFQDSNLEHAWFTGCKLNAANFRGVDLQNTHFKECDLRSCSVDEGQKVEGYENVFNHQGWGGHRLIPV